MMSLKLVNSIREGKTAMKNESRIIELNDDYAPKGFPVIAINPNDSEISPGDNIAATLAAGGQPTYCRTRTTSSGVAPDARRSSDTLVGTWLFHHVAARS